ncbi:MbnP family protein [Ruegeria arenilitoris]|uniref:MbnP family protein n=1 Tax=Ruegeria arenilitoris TaxID=1173585 RepID=UPI003463E652
MVQIAGWFLLTFGQQIAISATLNFHAQMGEAPLIYNQIVNENPSGEGQFRARDFSFYISNLSLGHADETYVETDSYLLLHILQCGKDAFDHFARSAS